LSFLHLFFFFNAIRLSFSSILLLLIITLSDLFGFGILSPMFFKLSEARCMIFKVIASKGDVAVDANEGGWSTPSKAVIFCLLLLEGGITVRADKGYHFVEVY
jgi:hypothetical protein